MNYIKVLPFLLFVFLFPGSSIFAQGQPTDLKKDQKTGEAFSTADPQKGGADTENEVRSWAGGAVPDERFEMQDKVVIGTSFRWLTLGGSYLLVPSPGWYSNQYSGSLLTSLGLTEKLRFMYLIQYSYYHTTRDDNFPERLQKLGNHIVLSGGWFQVGVSVSSKSDVLFRAFDMVNIGANVNFEVWRSGHHSILIGAIFSSRAELWKSVLPLPTFAYRFMMPGLLISVGLPMFLVWRPNETVQISLYGILPGVGNARVKFNLHRYVSLSLHWSHQKEPYYLDAYPFHDLRYVGYFLKEVLNYRDEREERKKFVLETQRAGMSFAVNIEDYVTISVYNGLQFASSYYRTDNILARNRHGERIANAYIFEAGIRGLLYDPRFTK
jgi:hypothetical protein